MSMRKLTGKAAILAAAICVAAALPSWAAARTISADYALADDETVDGTLTVASGVTVDLNGHNLTVGGLAGDGTITAGAQDLTSPDPNGERVWSPTTFHREVMNATILFNNNYVRGDDSNRVLVASAKLPLAVTYDFGAGNPQRVDMYKVYVGPLGSLYKRGPKTWTFEGTDDTNGTWTVLHSKDNETWPTTQETRTYTFENDTAYRYYRISFTAATATDYLELVQLEYFDSSAVPEIPPELRVNVPAGATVTNSTVEIGGNIRLVKQGAGTFVAARANQTYSGGNHVAAGTIKPISQNVDLLFGANGTDIAVDSDAAFDINGNSRCSLYRYVMNGGTAMNSGNALGANYAQLGDMTLTANSYVDSVGFIKSDFSPLTIDLGGNVLEVADNKNIHIKNADITNGVLRISRVGANSAVYIYSSNARTATLDLGTHTGLYDADLSVSNLLLRSEFTAHTGANANRAYRVYGTFKTETAMFPFVRFMDGSAFDLKSWDGTFNSVSTSTHASGFRLLYDAGATVTIDIAGRTPALGECLISWDAMPQNVTFQFDETTAAGGVAPVVADSGLLYGYIADKVEQAWWTGGAGDGVLSNPGNWLCKNAIGDTVTGAAALPSADTHIYLEGSLNAINASAALACRLCTLTNATLAGDCDLRGFGTNLQVAANAVIDLNGHKLYARSAAFTGVCTVKGADIGHADDLTANDASRVSSPTTFHVSGMTAANLFNNNYSRNTSGTTKRIIVNQGGMPLEATYDFGEGQEKVVDAYRIWTGKIEGYTQRLPRVWKFEGSNDNENWTLLDKRGADAAWQAANMHRTYTFPNTTAYRYYRITITENNGPDSDGRIFLELVQLEYLHLKPTQGELHLETAAGETVAPANMTLSGNLRFFIEGAGTLNLSKTGQTYIGGTEICGGTVSGGPTGDLLYTDIFGEEGSEVVVHGDGTTTISATNAVLGFLNRTGYTGYKYVLAGGLINNADDGIVTELRLTADSYMQVTSAQSSNYAWIGRSGDRGAAYADLGGHELSLTASSGKHFGLMNATLENGSLHMRVGGWFATTNSVVATNNVTLTVNCASDIAGSVAVKDYIVLQENKNYNSGAGVIDVYGTFGTVYRLYHGTMLHDGSTIDFTRFYPEYDTEIPSSLPTVAVFNANQTGDKTLRFEPGATIGVKLGTRKFAKGTRVISWDSETAPDATVTFVRADTDRKYRLVKESDGLYYYPSGGFMMIVK